MDRSWTNPNMRYIRAQKSTSDRILVACERGKESELMAFAKKIACVGWPPPAKIEKINPSSMYIHSFLLNDAINTTKDQSEYFGPFCTSLSARILLEMDLVVFVLPRANFSSSGSNEIWLPVRLDCMCTSSSPPPSFSFSAWLCSLSSLSLPMRCADTRLK